MASMLTRLPLEVLRIVTSFLDGPSALLLYVTGDSSLRFGLSHASGIDSFTVNGSSQHLKRRTRRPTATKVPTLLSRMHGLKTLRLAGRLDVMGSFHPSLTLSCTYLQSAPVTLTSFSFYGLFPLRCFFNARVIHIPNCDLMGDIDVLESIASRSSSTLLFDPWLPLRELAPNLLHLTLRTPHPGTSSSQNSIWEALEAAFFGQLPPNLLEFKTNVFCAPTARLSRLLPASLETWTVMNPESVYWRWQQLPSVPLEPAALEELPRNLTRLRLSSATATLIHSITTHLIHLQKMRIEHQVDLLDATLLSRALVSLRIDETLHGAYEEARLWTSAHEIQHLPTSLTSLHLSFKLDVKVISALPESMRRLHIHLGGETWKPIVWPRSLTRLWISVPTFALESLTCLPHQLTELDLEVYEWTGMNALSYHLGDEGPTPHTNSKPDSELPLPLPLLQSHKSLVSLVISKGNFTITTEILLAYPALTSLELPTCTLLESTFLHPRFTQLRHAVINTVLLTGHALARHPEAIGEDGEVTRLTLIDAITYWTPRTSLNTVQRWEFGLETLPEGAKHTRNLPWLISRIANLPSTLTSLGGGFHLSYQDLFRIPPSITLLEDVSITIDESGAEAIMINLRQLKLPHLHITDSFLKHLHPNIKVGSNTPTLELELSDKALSYLWPELEELVITESFSLPSSWLPYVPRSLRKLRIADTSLGSRFWALAPELTSLEDLSLALPHLAVLSRLPSLPRTLKALTLETQDEFAPAQYQTLTHIPIDDFQALPEGLTALNISIPNDLPNSCICLLPRSLKTLTLESRHILNPPWHEFPINLVHIHLPSCKTASLLTYLERKRKS